MGGKSGPSVPNPAVVAGKQAQADIQSTIANAYLSNIDTYGPLGSTNYKIQDYKLLEVPDGRGRTIRMQVPIYEQVNRLSKNQQDLLENQEQAGINLGQLAAQQSADMQGYLRGRINESQLPGQVTNAGQAEQLLRATSPEDFVAEKHRTEEALMARLNPQIDRDREALLTRLANQGVVTGSEAYNRELDAFGRQTNDARMQAILGAGQEQNRLYGLEQQRVGQANEAIQGNFANQQAYEQQQQTLRQQGLQEDIALRNQPLSEIAQLLHGSSPTIPQFQGWNPVSIPRTPVADSYYRSAALEQQAYAMQQQQMAGLYGGLGSIFGGLFSLSDRRAKENIRRVGQSDNGIPLYLYNYIGETEPRIGPMADEVEKVKPWAVGERGGFKTVNYALALGV